MKNLFQQIMSDVDGKGSSTRVTMFTLLLLLCIITIGVTFFHSNFNSEMWSSIFWGVLAFGGMVKAEKFTGRTPDLTTTNKPANNDTNNI